MEENESKTGLRSRLRAARRHRDPASFESAEIALASFSDLVLSLGGGPVAAFLPTATEPPIDALVDALVAAGRVVLMPRPSPDGSLEWVPWTGTAPASGMKAGLRVMDPALRVPVPVGEPIGSGAAPISACSAILIPALAVTESGQRLGQGGGFYDRVLSELHGIRHLAGPIRIAVVWDEEVVDEVPVEAHDQLVDAVLTPWRYLKVRNPEMQGGAAWT